MCAGKGYEPHIKLKSLKISMRSHNICGKYLCEICEIFYGTTPKMEMNSRLMSIHTNTYKYTFYGCELENYSPVLSLGAVHYLPCIPGRVHFLLIFKNVSYPLRGYSDMFRTPEWPVKNCFVPPIQEKP